MQSPIADSGRSFHTRFSLLTFTASFVAPAFVVLYLVALLRLTPEQVTGLWWTVLAAVVLSTPVGTPTFLYLNRRIRRYLDARAAGGATPEQVRDAFACAVDLPRQLVWAGWALVMLPGTGIALAMLLRYDDFSALSFWTIEAAGFSSGLVSAIFQAYLLKSWLQPLCEHLAGELGSVEEQAERVRRLTLSLKLRVVVVAMTAAPLVFAAFFASESSRVAVEAQVARQEETFLAAAAARLGRGAGTDPADPARLDALAADLALFGAPFDAGVVDLASNGPAPGTPLDASELAWLRGNVELGSADPIQSPRVVRWVRLGAAPLALVAWSEREALEPVVARMAWIFGVLIAVSMGLGLVLATQAGRDVGASADRLHREAERIADGDLREPAPFVSEDEMGDLGRSFATMRAGLRGLVRQVARAVEGVDGAAGEVGTGAERVLAGAEASARGAEQANQSMARLRDEASAVHGSAGGLADVVEESSANILELSSAGQQLSDSAGGLSSRMDEGASSVEQMVRNVREMGESSTRLGRAATTTCERMEAMAEALGSVAGSAGESAALSQSVVGAAESGRERVAETIAGMESIRVATEEAQRVIGSLGERASRIGAILDVIDNVADETNLLALNAAVIAAQAGEQGRAFAVVADEIKDLADRVLSSTKEIAEVIRAVQEEASNAVGAIRGGVESVGRGVQLSRQAGDSLEEIDRASRDSGERIAQIVEAVRQQSEAARGVAREMEQVVAGVEQIQRAAAEHEAGSDVVLRSTEHAREVAGHVHSATREHAEGCDRLRRGVEGVREAAQAIERSLATQSETCAELARFLEDATSRAQDNSGAAGGMSGAARALRAEAEALREAVGRFEA